MLVRENGPFGIFMRFREWSGIVYDDEGEMVSWNDKTPLVCIYCTSIWAALGLLLLPIKVKDVLAVSGLASVVFKWQERLK